MATINEMINRLNSLNIQECATAIFEENKEEYLDLNKEQLQEGKLSTGNEITPQYRNNKYARMKQGRNSKPPYGVPDLKLTGAFYRGFKINLFGDTIKISSTDSKASDLEAKYSGDIYGLSEEKRAKFSSLYGAKFVKFIRERLKL